MFDIGFWEIFLILVLALIVIGPERLPRAARTAGYWVGRARRFIEGVKSDVEQEFDVNEFKRLIHNQEVQINELQRKLSGNVDLTGDSQAAPRYDMFDEETDSDDGNQRKVVAPNDAGNDAEDARTQASTDSTQDKTA